MSFLTSLPFKFLLPLILLGLQFGLKFFIDRRATAFNFVTAILEIPISMLFLTLSLISAYIIASKGDVQYPFMMFVAIVILLIFCIFFWRRSVEHFEKENFGYASCLGILNLVLSLPTLIYVIYYLINDGK